MPNSGSLTFTPFGGLGEIGLNCSLLTTGGGSVLIDCGLMFPEDHHLGVDVVIPRFDEIVRRRDTLRGIILTHGHEDHIGALPWLVRQMPATIFGSSFTLALAAHKLAEHELLDQATLVTVEPYENLVLGDLAVRFFPVSHSIIQGYALALDTPPGRMFYTGDFKIDPCDDPAWATSLEAIRSFAGDEGALALFSDSTNVESLGHSMSETVVRERFQQIFRDAPGRIIITLFSSNIRRIQNVFDLAAQSGRKVAVDGRSLVTNIETAREKGLLHIPPGLCHDITAISDLPGREQTLLVTGSQGEPLSVLARIAENEYRGLRITAGDTVIMSSRMIPGNSRAISRVIDKLYRLGAEVLYDSLEDIHASGHAHAQELRSMLEAVRPRYFVPIHGEYRHLVKHARLARECGVGEERTLVLSNGQPVTFWANAIRHEHPVPVDSILVDGKGVGDVGQLLLRERQILGEEGVVSVLIVYEEGTRALLRGPEIQSRGFVFERVYGDILEEAAALALAIFHETPASEMSRLGERLRAGLRRFFKNTLGRDPVILPHLAAVPPRNTPQGRPPLCPTAPDGAPAKEKTMAIAIATKKAPAALGPYSQAVKAGNLVFTSGQLGIDPATGELPETVEDQARQSLLNIRAVLQAAGTDMDRVCKTLVFLADMNDFAAVNAVYETFFTTLLPARSCVQAAALPRGARVEIEAVAVI